MFVFSFDIFRGDRARKCPFRGDDSIQAIPRQPEEEGPVRKQRVGGWIILK